MAQIAPEFDARQSRQAAEKAVLSEPPSGTWFILTVLLLGFLTVNWAKILTYISQNAFDSESSTASIELHRYAKLYDAGSPSLPIILGLLPGFLAILLGGLGYAYARYRSYFIIFGINKHIADAVVCCARMQEQEERRIASTARRLDRTCRMIEKKILAAHRHRRTIARRSPRHASARAHALRVAGALRIQLSGLDADLRTESKGLALMLLEIGEQYAKGAIGKLLSEESLSGVQPVSRAREALRESLHYALTVTVMSGAALVTNALVPESVVPADMRALLMIGAAAVAGIPTGGWSRFTRLLEIFPGR
ncbi:hypothetical protein ACOT81_20805 [Streptomyces sp. WI04-05B]|uniref:hypothetical protein n=1 Tax=Streptomyces echiniscabiei TaxID=3028708 RepID=UPI003B9CB380